MKSSKGQSFMCACRLELSLQTLLGVVSCSVLIKQFTACRWLPLTDLNGTPLEGKDLHGQSGPSKVHITIQYKPVEQEQQVSKDQHLCLLGAGLTHTGLATRAAFYQKCVPAAYVVLTEATFAFGCLLVMCCIRPREAATDTVRCPARIFLSARATGSRSIMMQCASQAP